MANKKISELPAATTEDGSELLEIVQGGINKQTTFGRLNSYRGAYDASGNTYPAAGGGSGQSGAIRAGDLYYFSVAATNLDSQAWPIGTLALALVNTPGQTTTNWRLI